jgi:hypothetical protein
MLLDADYPSRKDPSKRAWNHWLVVNVPASSSGKVLQGAVLAAYNPPTPPQDGGSHRFLTVVYKQPAALPAAQRRVSTEFEHIRKQDMIGLYRAGFNHLAWLHERRMEGGQGFKLVAAQWLHSEFDTQAWYAGNSIPMSQRLGPRTVRFNS